MGTSAPATTEETAVELAARSASLEDTFLFGLAASQKTTWRERALSMIRGRAEEMDGCPGASEVEAALRGGQGSLLEPFTVPEDLMPVCVEFVRICFGAGASRVRVGSSNAATTASGLVLHRDLTSHYVHDFALATPRRSPAARCWIATALLSDWICPGPRVITQAKLTQDGLVISSAPSGFEHPWLTDVALWTAGRRAAGKVFDRSIKGDDIFLRPASTTEFIRLMASAEAGAVVRVAGTANRPEPWPVRESPRRKNDRANYEFAFRLSVPDSVGRIDLPTRLYLDDLPASHALSVPALGLGQHVSTADRLRLADDFAAPLHWSADLEAEA